MKTYQRKTNTEQPVNRRRGSVMVAAAICLLLATVLLASVIQLARTGRRQVRRDQLQVQANWLVEAGLERAAARLEAEAGYPGETWNIAADDLDGQHAGQVVIKVNPAVGEEGLRIVMVEASYPAGATPSATRTRQSKISIATE